jgi:signal transduction histidine kinase
MTEPLSLEELRAVDLFDALSDEELAAWLPVATVRELPPGEIIAELGEEPPGVQFLLAGEVRSYMSVDGRFEPVNRQQAPTWMGAIAVLTEAPLGVRMQTATDCRVALVLGDDFRRLTMSQPSVHRRVMQAVTPVMTRLTAIEQNRDRLASLGTMAAGLAHELGNPASAAARAAAQMTESLTDIGSALESFVAAGVEREQAAELVTLHHEALSHGAACTALDALDAADAEDELLDALEELGVPDAWQLVEPLTAANLGRDWLERVAAAGGPATGAALRWISASLTAGRLAEELQEATARMIALVKAVKSYAYMDRGEIVEIDLHEGLETTLTVLGHKLKNTEIKVVRNYAREMPKLTVRGSELNQVWTNLIDNAIDALGQSGTITISTSLDGTCEVVEISDDGPGIPPDVKARIFDPFFTTKDVGSGTGLGLATARQIVVDRHDGSLKVESRPGATTFRVRLSPAKP